MRRVALLCCALLPACGSPGPDAASEPHPGGPCPVPPYTDLAAPDGRPLAVDVGDVAALTDQVLVLGPQVVVQATPDSLAVHREWLGARFPAPTTASDAPRSGTTTAEPVPLPPGIEPPTLLRGLSDGDGWRVVGTSPLPSGTAGSAGTWIWTARLGPAGWSGVQGIARPELTPPEIGGSDPGRAGQDFLWAVPLRAPGGWLLVRLGPGGLEAERIPVPLPYLVPLRFSPGGLEAIWVEAEVGPGGSWANSLFRGTIPLDHPGRRAGSVLRRGGQDEVHHPLLAPGGQTLGFVSGPSERSRGWILSLEAGGVPTPVPGPAVAEVAPVRGGEGSGAPREWVAVTAGTEPLTLTWLAEDTPEPSVLARIPIPHGLPPKALRVGDALLLVGSRFLGPEGPGRFSTVRTAVAVLTPGCVDDARDPFPQSGRSP